MPLVLFCIAVFLLDQLTKDIISSGMHIGESIPVIPNVFHITYIINRGAAFGMLENQQWLFIIVTVAVIAAVACCFKKLIHQDRLVRFGVALLMGGAAGNLLDRIRLSGVVDFFDFRIWPVFNVADIAIVAGVILLAYILIFRSQDI